MAKYFSWDPAKARTNKIAHRISFETAVRAFDDPYAVQYHDQRIDDEDRWHTIGMVDGHLLLLVVHLVEEEDGDEYIRIISARKAETKYEKTYFAINRERGCFAI